MRNFRKVKICLVIFNHIKILSQDEMGEKRKRKGEKEEVARTGYLCRMHLAFQERQRATLGISWAS